LDPLNIADDVNYNHNGDNNGSIIVEINDDLGDLELNFDNNNKNEENIDEIFESDESDENGKIKKKEDIKRKKKLKIYHIWMLNFLKKELLLLFDVMMMSHFGYVRF